MTVRPDLMSRTAVGCRSELRHAMGQFATGVTVVTTVLPDGSPVGCTVNAFCSVSEDPPLVLVCIGRERFMHEALVSAPGYTVNILSVDQADVARRFSDVGTDRFADLPTRPGIHGIPVLAEAIASVQCDLDRIVDGGDHVILLGAVRQLIVNGGHPLLYSRGRLLDGAG